MLLKCKFAPGRTLEARLVKRPAPGTTRTVLVLQVDGQRRELEPGVADCVVVEAGPEEWEALRAAGFDLCRPPGALQDVGFSAPSSEYRATRGVHGCWIPLGFFFAGTLALLAVFNVLVVAGDAYASPFALLPTLFLAVAAGGVTVWALAARKEEPLTRQVRVLVYPAGLKYVTAEEEQQLPWESIDAVWQQSIQHGMGRIYHNYRIRTRDGRRFRFLANIANVHELGQQIHDQLTRRQLPQMRAALEQGEQVDFDKIVLGPKGLKVGRRRPLYWEDVDKVVIRRGKICIYRREPRRLWAEVEVRDTPNIFALMGLLSERVPCNLDSLAERWRP
jgi:hypothetical protein